MIATTIRPAVADLSDQQLLAMLETAELPRNRYASHYSLARTGLLASSAELICPPTYKAYRGHVGVGVMRDVATKTEWFLFIGYTTFGPGQNPNQQVNIHGWTGDLDDAIKMVNKTLKTKLRKGYHNDMAGASELLHRGMVIETIEQMTKNGKAVLPS
jgi:hypothetical protein